MKKSQIRQAKLNQRNLITPVDRKKLSQKIAQNLCDSIAYQKAQHIACYHAIGNEVDTQNIIEDIWRSGKHCYLPIVMSDNTLGFAEHFPESTLKNNKFGILEPAPQKMINALQLDLVLMPLVAFDSQGNRIGMGAGYYDKTFAQVSGQVDLVGLAYAMQEINSIEPDDWDVVMSSVVTELTC